MNFPQLAATLPPMTQGKPIQVDVRDGLTPQEFRREYYEQHRPVVMRGAAATWKAMGALTPEYLKEHYGHRQIHFGEGNFRLAEVVDRLIASDPARPAPYPCKLNLDADYADLLPFFDPLPLAHSEPNRVRSKLVMAGRFGSKNELFLGGPGGEFPYIHYDYYHLNAWITEIYGEKEFTVYSAPNEACFYPVAGDEWKSGIVNPFNPDLAKYPLFRDVTATTVILHPGETLFIPNGTWHSARSLSVTISVAFDQLGARNMKSFVTDVFSRRVKQKPVVASALAAYLTGVGAALTVAESLRSR